jgi:hypothetical protein
MLSACATELTPCWYELLWLNPVPSLTVTDSVQFCVVPVAFAGAVQIGVRLDALSKDPFKPRAAGQLAVHA